MASFLKKAKKIATGLSDTFLGPATTNIFADREDPKADKKKARKDKISAFIESLGDEFETEVKGFDAEGDPELLPKRKKKADLQSDPKKPIQEALLFDENLPEIGEKIGLKRQAQGFPVAGGGGALPSASGGEFDPAQLQTIQTPDFGQVVRDALLERSQPGVAPAQATKNVFGIKEQEASGITPEFEEGIAAIFEEGQEVEDPRAELKKLIPLYAGNKEALDRLKLLISLYPEI